MADEEFNIATFVAKIEQERQERAQRPRSFELCGEQFTHRAAVEMEAVAAYFDMTTARVDVSSEEAVSIIDATVIAFLEPGHEEKWHKVRHHPENPITYQDAHDLIEGLLRSLTGRPTGQSIGSTDGRENGTTNSTESLPSKESSSTG